jgi:acyl carrier protein
MDMTEKVLALLTHELRLRDAVISVTSNLKEDLDVGSLEAVEILMELEDEFKIESEEKDHEHLVTVQDVINLVNQLVK